MDKVMRCHRLEQSMLMMTRQVKQQSLGQTKVSERGQQGQRVGLAVTAEGSFGLEATYGIQRPHTIQKG